MIRRALLIMAVLIVFAANGIAFGLASWNRAGSPASELVLSERELAPRASGPRGESSARSLAVITRTATGFERNQLGHYGYYDVVAWLTVNHLVALGFDAAGPPADARSKLEPWRPGLFVLELDGPARKTVMAALRGAAADTAAQAAATPDDKQATSRAAYMAQQLEAEDKHGTRLYIVDCGPDAAALRRRYPDTSRYAIAAGRIQVYDRYPRGIPARIELTPTVLHVPSQWHDLVSVDPVLPKDRRPLQVTVQFGQAGEAWISEMTGNP